MTSILYDVAVYLMISGVSLYSQNTTNGPCAFRLTLLLAAQNERTMRNVALFLYKAFNISFKKTLCREEFKLKCTIWTKNNKQNWGCFEMSTCKTANENESVLLLRSSMLTKIGLIYYVQHDHASSCVVCSFCCLQTAVIYITSYYC